MKLIKILGILLILTLLADPVFADVAVGETGIGAQPGDQDPRICVEHREVLIGAGVDPVGINGLAYRTGMYAFAGERLEYTIVVRDPNGALDIGFPKIQVGEDPYLVYPDWLELMTKGNGEAGWTESNSYVGDHSILLGTNGPDGTGNEGTIHIPLDMTLGELETLSWLAYVQQGYIPHVDIKLDLNGDGYYTSGVDDGLVIEYDKSTTPSDQPIGSMGYQYNNWVQTFDDKMTEINNDTIAWLSSGAPGPVGGIGYVSGTLAQWKDGTVSSGVDENTKILALEIEVDDWIVISNAFIDDITINGQVYLLEPETMGGFYPEVLCNPVSLSDSCNGMGTMNPLTDRAYVCHLTVEPQWDGEKEVKITAYNSAFEPTDGTHVETWFFNPALSMSVSTSDGQAIHFEEMPYGATGDLRTVHSLNRLKVKNTAEGGVNMWMYLAGTDLTDPSGASKCPTTNVLTIDRMEYRGWSGTQWHSNEGWIEMGKYDQNAACDVISGGFKLGASDIDNDGRLEAVPTQTLKCYGGLPVPYDINALDAALSHVLTNQGNLEVEFKLTYPTPCVGSFTQGSLLVFGKAI